MLAAPLRQADSLSVTIHGGLAVLKNQLRWPKICPNNKMARTLTLPQITQTHSTVRQQLRPMPMPMPRRVNAESDIQFVSLKIKS
jgi:hypothetical protein